ncbi:sigma-70 family RNA polymerase sigma factor [Kitasatospora sp. NBC_01287]|uniref:sigma-70 family RNA polymerase sigma factor n=1 Tax=Kitasatospora sp. NBC_01287 TaxID=2903573 RepID=UPI00224FBA45|nr:sigma-70 family RNA polymerase sigma factor [Kitasatospora sp. NBC_01287]MCX4744762.1 sigma-70 family RNA polymerase sigma factor [Kitasatospora sp. NBC_01287]
MTSQQAEPDACERERLVALHGHLVEREAARYRTWHIERADLRQAGILGLLIAASRFDPERAVPFGAYAHTWVRKEIQRAISRQEFPAVLPADLVGRTVALRRALDENADSLNLAAAALGISPATVAALHRQLRTTGPEDDEELPAPGYVLTDPAHTAVAQDFISTVRTALARIDSREAEALILRYGLDDRPERSFREIGRHLGVSDHTAKKLVERAQDELRRLIT